ncbi:MAG TPA: AbrB/MazE/SpoVT family DNA-binding domain-containing protein [Candidatus Diapherotrites archaeon]|uniref:AbrB/MazE/SpoVT family DNA-binding domain-containing protein n=1 Tax=Candidatus Iainarchaeum sp. TaxID=3101447 RepID=A0A7J4JGQ6_9ARCH|nr:AbrB/MazE/SpoVT family DNA-binding domain-containing protein [Candidatus Diapherotrites archaeon]HIH16932.1 AbrB/MazE/SpoVT family DNA-binding domain-containing protein [Candidatus Diapherotrites archaeon]
MATIVETTKMSTKGQIIIPKQTRRFTDSSTETVFTVVPLDRDTIILRKVDPHKVVAEFQKIRRQIKDKLSEAEINEIVHRAR